MKYHKKFSYFKSGLKSGNPVILEPPILPFLRCLTFEDFFIFRISEKTFENIPNKVYIFLASYVRAFQNRFDHVYTTLVGDSTIARLGPII